MSLKKKHNMINQPLVKKNLRIPNKQWVKMLKIMDVAFDLFISGLAVIII